MYKKHLQNKTVPQVFILSNISCCLSRPGASKICRRLSVFFLLLPDYAISICVLSKAVNTGENLPSPSGAGKGRRLAIMFYVSL